MEISKFGEMAQKRRQILLDKKDSIYIVNAGVMNQGKSSLFNSLLDSEKLVTGDVQVTRKCMEIKFLEGVYLIDTPGLEAEDADDTEAQKAYKKANLIIFVHTPNSGEFHANELNWINRMAAMAPSKEYFWKHFCIVLTFKEAKKEQELENIKGKIRKDLQEVCGNADVPMFFVSNLRYWKGKTRKQDAFIKASGIQELRDFLKGNIKIWRTEARDANEKLFDNAKKEILEELEKERKQQQICILNKEKVSTSLIKRMDRKIEEYINVISRMEQEYIQAQKRAKGLKERIHYLERRREYPVGFLDPEFIEKVTEGISKKILK